MTRLKVVSLAFIIAGVFGLDACVRKD